MLIENIQYTLNNVQFKYCNIYKKSRKLSFLILSHQSCYHYFEPYSEYAVKLKTFRCYKVLIMNVTW